MTASERLATVKSIEKELHLSDRFLSEPFSIIENKKQEQINNKKKKKEEKHRYSNIIKKWELWDNQEIAKEFFNLK